MPKTTSKSGKIRARPAEQKTLQVQNIKQNQPKYKKNTFNIGRGS